MIAEAINKILALADPTRWNMEDGRVYASRSMVDIAAPLVAPINVQTLTGLVDLYTLHQADATEEQALIVHVLSHDAVQIIARGIDEWRRRAVFVQARVPSDAPRFKFGTFMEPDEFVIGLQTLFDPDPGYKDWAKLLRLVSNLTAEAVTIASDDGVSQTVATRQGMVMKNEEKVSPRVTLAPFRTFREIDQPPSEFVLRLRTRTGATPMAALFEADGNEWKLTAIDSIKGWLADKIKDADIVA